MSRSIILRTTTFVLAALLTLAMVATTDALAGHQYRVAADAQQAQVLAMNTQFVTVVGHRAAQG